MSSSRDGGGIAGDGSESNVNNVDDSQNDNNDIDRMASEMKGVSSDNADYHRPCWILPAIVFSQFAGTSLWFAGNAIFSDLQNEWDTLSEDAVSYVTSSVQFGFIVGTLGSAILNLADRLSPTRFFCGSSVFGAAMNALIPALDKSQSLGGLIVLRLFTGISLAGIYPVGMKIAADYYEGGSLGGALGWLVGALAVGSAFPFLLELIPQSWQALLWETSALALLGGLVIGCAVPNGPYRTPGTKWDPQVVKTLFVSPLFRSAAFGYLGHMWELYAFWTWCPVVWTAYLKSKGSNWDAGLVTFCIVATGGVGCVVGGYASLKYGSAWVASITLFTSGLMCVISPGLYLAPVPVALIFYLVWGFAVVADSPQFSSLIAQAAPAANKGTALTIVNSIGFAITIASIQLLGVPISEQYLFTLLTPGPIFGLWHMRRYLFPPRDSKADEIDDALSKNVGGKADEDGSRSGLAVTINVNDV